MVKIFSLTNVKIGKVRKLCSQESPKDNEAIDINYEFRLADYKLSDLRTTKKNPASFYRNRIGFICVCFLFNSSLVHQY